MINVITQVAAAVAALAGLITIIYKYYLSPKAKAKRNAKRKFDKAVDDGDRIGVIDAFNDTE